MKSPSDTTPARRRYELVGYFGLCFAIAWAVWIPAGILAPGSSALVIPGAWAPTIAAVLITWIMEGRSGLSVLFRGLWKWRVKVRYYLFAVFGMLSVGLLSVGIHVLLGGSPPDPFEIATRFGLPVEQAYLLIAFSPIIFLTTVFVGGPIAEELGWRGYAQPRMQTRIGAGWAGLVIGLIWSLWHLPLFYYFPSAVAGLPLAYYVPLVSALGVLFAWLYNQTGGSVLLCILFHAGVNFSLGVLGAGALSEDGRLATILILSIGVVAVALHLRIRTVEQVPR